MKKTVPPELNIRRLTVDEALFRLDRYLNHAFLAGLSTVHILHGKGTGTLRRAIHQELAKHQLVKSFRSGDVKEGGEGVTIIELVENKSF